MSILPDSSKSLFALVMRAVIAAAFIGQAAGYEVKPMTDGQAAEYKLDRSFYGKCTMVQGILIASSKGVSDHTQLEVA